MHCVNVMHVTSSLFMNDRQICFEVMALVPHVARRPHFSTLVANVDHTAV